MTLLDRVVIGMIAGGVAAIFFVVLDLNEDVRLLRQQLLNRNPPPRLTSTLHD